MKKLSLSMTQGEIIGGWVYMGLQLLVLPVLLSLINLLAGSPLSDAVLNFVFFALNFICVTVIFRRFLIASLRQTFNAPLQCLSTAFFGFLLYYGTSYVVSMLIYFIAPDFVNVNDDSIAGMTQENFVLMSIGTVLLVPPVEELLYRGLIFRGLYNSNRVMAYIVSTFVFCAIHVFGYIGFYDPFTLLLCFLQYIPAGLCLGWAYAKADSIWPPILIHITVNLIGISAMR